MENAYDRVEWNFLFSTLHKFGFHPKWVESTKVCITTASYSVIANDDMSGFFFTHERHHTRGSHITLPVYYLYGGLN